MPRRSIRSPPVEIVLPQLGVELEVGVAAPDVVHKQIEAAVVSVDALDEIAHLLAFEVIHPQGDPHAPGGGNQLTGLFDRFRPVDLRPACPAAAPGGVDRGTRAAKLDGNRTSGAARGACD